MRLAAVSAGLLTAGVARYEDLKERSPAVEAKVDPARRANYLSDEDFQVCSMRLCQSVLQCGAGYVGACYSVVLDLLASDTGWSWRGRNI
eukprot:2375605-Rhodomonas_salina.5